MPDAELRERIAALADGLPVGGRPVPPQNYHLTLRFLGNALSADEEADVRRLARGVEWRPFSVTLDCIDSFRRGGRVIWLGSSQMNPAATALHEALAGENGVQADAGSRRFVPHVTLVRDAPAASPARSISPLHWTIDSFSLMRSLPNPLRYEVVESFPATGADAVR